MDNPALVETLCSVGDAGMRFFNIPGRHKVYWFSNEEHVRATLRVIDTRTNAVATAFNAGYHVSGMCSDHTGDYVYCATVDSAVLVVDTRTDSLVATVLTHAWASTREPLAPNRSTNRIYVAQFSSLDGNGIPVIRDSIIMGLEEHAPTALAPHVDPTFVSRSMPLRVQITSTLYDAFGRRVTVLHDGQNDVSCLAPGVYFVREEPQAASHRLQAARKIIIYR